MSILWVVPLLAAAVLVFALAFGQIRNPNSHPLFRAEATASAAAMFTTALLGFAIIGAAINPVAMWESFLVQPLAYKSGLAAVLIGAVALAAILLRTTHRAKSSAPGAEIVPLPPRGPARHGHKQPGAPAGRRRAA